jgi:hypothetical protein
MNGAEEETTVTSKAASVSERLYQKIQGQNAMIQNLQ